MDKKEAVENPFLIKAGYLAFHESHRNTILKYQFPAGLKLHSELHFEEDLSEFCSFSFRNYDLVCGKQICSYFLPHQ